MYEISPMQDECPFEGVTISAQPDFSEFADDFPIPCYGFMYETQHGVRDASKRHDELARRKYVKPFKWFKFNRARKATAK